MTTNEEGRNGVTSVAALAIQLDKLRRDIQALTAKVDTLADTQHVHGAGLDGIAELRTQVERILATLTSEADETQPTWCWLTMTDEDREEKLAELSDWVETVLGAEYPDYLADHLKPCWPNHPEARWELAWLYQLWTRAYLVKRPDPKDAADWHDRWLAGVVRRLHRVVSQCNDMCQRTDHAATKAPHPSRP